MPKRLLAPLALVVLLLGAGCTEADSEALQIDEVSYTFDELMAEVDEWAGNEALAGNFQSQGMVVESPAGDPGTDLTGFVIGFLVERKVVLDEFDRRTAEDDSFDVSPQATAAAEEQLETPNPEGASIKDGWSASYYDSILDYLAKQFTLVEELGGPEQYTELIGGLIESADVEVSSRFGRWDPGTQQVLPPEGPVTTTTAFDPLAAGAAG